MGDFWDDGPDGPDGNSPHKFQPLWVAFPTSTGNSSPSELFRAEVWRREMAAALLQRNLRGAAILSNLG